MPRQSGEWILALDVGTDAGYALRNTTTNELTSGHFAYKKKPEHRPGRRYIEFENCLDSLAADRSIVRVCCEEPMGNYRSHAATLVVSGYICLLQAWCEKMRLPYRGYPQKTIKKFATGSGAAKKPEMIAAAKERWPERNVKTDDEADALWVLELDRSESG